MTTPLIQSNDGQGSLKGRKIFIVGAGSGMGAALATMAVARGAKVAFWSMDWHRARACEEAACLRVDSCSKALPPRVIGSERVGVISHQWRGHF